MKKLQTILIINQILNKLFLKRGIQNDHKEFASSIYAINYIINNCRHFNSLIHFKNDNPNFITTPKPKNRISLCESCLTTAWFLHQRSKYF